MRVVVDTNVWVSAALRPTGFASQVVSALATRTFEVVMSDELMRELAEVLWRPRLRERYGLRAEDITATLALVGELVTRISDPSIVAVSRDAKDDVFAAVAVAAGAEVLVTRDDDLKRDPAVLAYLTRAGCEVLSVRAFLERFA